MPIYEFYCRHCHRIFSFFSRRIDTTSRPACPGCKRKSLSREVSPFASTGRRQEGADGGEGGAGEFPIDEARMESAMEKLSQEAAGLDENDPRQAAKLMRKFTDATGMKLGGGMGEAMRRLESGEDPEAVEAELGDQLEKEDPFVTGGGRKAGGKKQAAPSRDTTLYEM